MRQRVLAFAVLLAGAGCDPPAAKPTAAPASPGSAAPAPSAPRVEVKNGAKPGSVEVIVHEAISLDAKLLVERVTDTGGFEPVPSLDLDAMKLVESCGEKIGTCVALEPGRTVRPVPWSGMSCSSQCNGNCDKNVPREGRHRFVVVSCDGTQRFAGPVFEMIAR